MTKRAKRFRKKLMSVGIGRNAANWVCGFKSNHGALKALAFLSDAMKLPGAYCIVNVTASPKDFHFKVKRLDEE